MIEQEAMNLVRIADLEKRVKELEARPIVVVYPAQQYNPYVWPQNQPWSWPIITCTSGSRG